MNSPKIPDLPIISGEIADYQFDDSGILYSYSKNPKRTIENISKNVALVQSITQNTPVPLLIFLCDSPIPDKETRIFSKKQLPILYKAMAMVGKPGLSQLIMNILFQFSQPPIPMKSFSNKEAAKRWLQQFITPK